jgi:hypothetical protein
MKRVASFVPAIASVLTIALATPAMALNPQPLPPRILPHGSVHRVAAFGLPGHGLWNRCPVAMCRR